MTKDTVDYDQGITWDLYKSSCGNSKRVFDSVPLSPPFIFSHRNLSKESLFAGRREAVELDSHVFVL